MVMTATLMLGLVLAVGLCIDIARFYMVRAELQNAADAAALSAVRDLNSEVQGLADAYANATDAIGNTYNFNQNSISVARVEFSINLDFDGSANCATNPTSKCKAWDPTKSVAQNKTDLTSVKTARFVRVTTATAAISVLFAGAAFGSSHNETGVAVAGMSVGLNRLCFFPIIIALTPENRAALKSGDQLTVTFDDNITGSAAALADHQYAVIEVDAINGTGHVETVVLAGGGEAACGGINESMKLDSSQSGNPKPGRDAIAKGANSRFDDPDSYRGAGGLTPELYPPDTNVAQGITSAQYLNKSPLTPPPTHTGQDERRVLIMPMTDPLPGGSSPNIQIKKFGAFLLRNAVTGASNCGPNTWCGADLQIEYMGPSVVGRGSFDPTLGESSNLTVPVLYK